MAQASPALPKNAPIGRVEAALPKSFDLKSFRIRTYEKRRGEGEQIGNSQRIYRPSKRSLGLIRPVAKSATIRAFADRKSYSANSRGRTQASCSKTVGRTSVS